MLREDSLLGVNAINQRDPTGCNQEESDGIPFLKVVADVRDQVRKVDGVTDDAVRSSRYQASQSRPDAEKPAQGEQANKTKNRREDDQNQADCRPRFIPGPPPQIDDLGIRIKISDPDRYTGSDGIIPHLRPRAGERDSEYREMFQNINPIGRGKSGCQYKKQREFYASDGEQKEIGKPSSKHKNAR